MNAKTALSAAALLLGTQAEAAFVITLSSTDIGITSVYNTINSFQIEITVADPLVAGALYNNPTLDGVDYQVFGSLPDPTPSGFPAFALSRTLPGNSFYSMSPDATVNFSISPTADLSDGLQVSDLAGTGTVFTFNARELNQAPGRYHPPILTLNDDGTGSLANSNNMSTIPNPAPPIGSGALVDVTVGEEYDTTLDFLPSLTLSTSVPEPSAATLLLAATIGCISIRRRP